jgi:Mlc titration factor MtfA (ptsG expression regulator)
MELVHFFRERRRRALAEQPFPAAWAEIVDRNVAYVRRLHPDERKHLEVLIQIFIAEKNFEGCNGVVVTDEMRVTIAAQACLLLLNLPMASYDRLSSILIYPDAFSYAEEIHDDAGLVTLDDEPVNGLASNEGAIALSWPDALAGAQQCGDGENVILHEFAHQLDELDDAVDGAPALESRTQYRDWARVLSAEYARLQRDVEHGVPGLIDSYAATHPAEFFAVVTELFFERPQELKREYPALYDEVKQYYRQDPAARTENEEVTDC